MHSITALGYPTPQEKKISLFATTVSNFKNVDNGIFFIEHPKTTWCWCWVSRNLENYVKELKLQKTMGYILKKK